MFKVTFSEGKDVVLVTLFLTLNIFCIFPSIYIVNFEHVIAGWVMGELFCCIKTIDGTSPFLKPKHFRGNSQIDIFTKDIKLSSWWWVRF